MNLSRKQFAQFAQISLPVFGSERRDFSRKIYGPGRNGQPNGQKRTFMAEHLHPDSPSVACAFSNVHNYWNLEIVRFLAGHRLWPLGLELANYDADRSDSVWFEMEWNGMESGLLQQLTATGNRIRSNRKTFQCKADMAVGG